MQTAPVHAERHAEGHALEPTRATKGSDEILRPPSQKPSATQVHLEILSIAIKNRIIDKGQS